MEAFRIRREEEMAKLREMNGREKAGYIWEYYKIPIIVFVVLVFIIASLVNNILNPPKKPYLGIALMGGYMDEEAAKTFTGSISDAIIPEDEKELFEVQMNFFFFNEEDPQMLMAYQQKFMAMLATNELDVLIIEGEELPGYAEQEIISDLRATFGGNELSGYGDYVAYVDGAPFGIRLDGNNFLAASNLRGDGLMLTVVINSNKTDEVKAAVRCIMSGN